MDSVKDFTELSFAGKRVLVATTGSYEYREALKEEGFKYMKERRCWEMSESEERLGILKEKYPAVTFALR